MKDFFAQTIRMPTWVIVVVAAIMVAELINLVIGFVNDRKEKKENNERRSETGNN